MSKKLEDIRKKIDSLDDRIHDLLMERADLIVDVTAEKQKRNIQVVQPAREAVMIRRLLARHRGPLPEAAIVGIWRELVGAVSLLQTGLKVCVGAGDHLDYCWDMARNYFGTVLPMNRVATPLAAVSALREDEVSFAVVPWPQDGETNPWWTFLFTQEPERIRIVCALPHGRTQENTTAIQEKALVLCKTDFAPSGEDCSFIAISADHSLSRARIFDILKNLSLEPLSIQTKVGTSTASPNLHLAEVQGYVGEGDVKFEAVAQKFLEQNAQCLCIGGYPVPPLFKKAQATEQQRTKKDSHV